MTTGTERLELCGGGAPPQTRRHFDSARDAAPAATGAVPRPAVSGAPRGRATVGEPDEARAQLNKLRVARWPDR